MTRGFRPMFVMLMLAWLIQSIPTFVRPAMYVSFTQSLARPIHAVQSCQHRESCEQLYRTSCSVHTATAGGSMYSLRPHLFILVMPTEASAAGDTIEFHTISHFYGSRGGRKSMIKF